MIPRRGFPLHFAALRCAETSPGAPAGGCAGGGGWSGPCAVAALGLGGGAALAAKPLRGTGAGLGSWVVSAAAQPNAGRRPRLRLWSRLGAIQRGLGRGRLGGLRDRLQRGVVILPQVARASRAGSKPLIPRQSHLPMITDCLTPNADQDTIPTSRGTCIRLRGSRSWVLLAPAGDPRRNSIGRWDRRAGCCLVFRSATGSGCRTRAPLGHRSH